MRPTLWRLLAEAAHRSHWPVYLHGQAGRGKTSAMACLFRRWQHGQPVWLRLSGWINLIQQCRRNGSVMLPGSAYETSETSLWRTRVEQPGLLCVDDLGLRGPTESQFEILYELVDRRGRRPVVYTSNLPPTELHATYDGRIASRVLCGLEIELTGTDRRLAGSVAMRVD